MASISPEENIMHWKLIRLEICLFVFASISDLLITMFLMCYPDIYYEANPLANWMLQQWGFCGLAIHKFFWFGVAYIVLWAIMVRLEKEPEEFTFVKRSMRAACALMVLIVVYSVTLFAVYGT